MRSLLPLGSPRACALTALIVAASGCSRSELYVSDLGTGGASSGSNIATASTSGTGGASSSASASSGTGAASSSTNSGSSGTGGGCHPSPEVCDGLDNDCNGLVDDGDPGGGALCLTGQPGMCATGVTACEGGVIVCQPLEAPSAEVCDGLDNDCNGTVDDLCGVLGSQSADQLQGLALNAGGEVYVSGRRDNTTSLLARYDANLVLETALFFPVAPSGSPDTMAKGVAVDDAGNALVVGYFQNGTLDVGGTLLPGPGAGSTAFVAKWSPANTLVFASSLGAGRGERVAADGAGNLVVAGSVDATNACPVWKLGPSGGAQWTTVIAGSAGSAPTSAVAIDAIGDALIACGDTITKLGPAGDILFQRSFPGTYGAGIAVDGAGDAVVVGDALGPVNVGGHLFGKNGVVTVYVLKLDAAGNVVFAVGYPTQVNALSAADVAVSPSGETVFTGGVDGTVDFGGGPHSGLGQWSYVVRLDVQGHFVFGRYYDVTGGLATSLPTALRLDPAGDVVMCGYVDGTIDFGTGTPLASGPNGAGFVVKLQP